MAQKFSTENSILDPVWISVKFSLLPTDEGSGCLEGFRIIGGPHMGSLPFHRNAHGFKFVYNCVCMHVFTENSKKCPLLAPLFCFHLGAHL